MLTTVITVLLVAIFAVTFGFIAFGPAAVLPGVALGAVFAWWWIRNRGRSKP